MEKEVGKSNFYVDYKFKFEEGKEEYFFYKVDSADYDEAIKAYFSLHGVTLDGTEKSIFNVLSSLEVLSKLEEEAYFIDFLTTKCKDKAYEQFIEEKEAEKEFEKW